MRNSINYGKDSFVSPESSTIEGARYDGETKVMEITFHGRAGKNPRPARTYKYEGVIVEDWTRFKSASSKGTHFHSDIEPKYKGVKVSE